MDRHKIQKVNRALVASALAVGSVAVVSPSLHTVQAATSFKDLPSTSSHYSSIQTLVERNIVSGYTDGTFRPNASVTRAHAAVIIARVLNLDIQNVSNPNFKDVSTSHPYYGYIAALAQEGIISGFKDGTFRPDENMTRGQIATILVNSFKFEMASVVGTNFTDVNENTSHAKAIQTLVDLKITKGTTPLTYSPYSHVTRGQLATLIVASEKVKSAKPDTYKITGISGTTVYLNSVPYKLDDTLENFINEENEEILTGAVFQGKVRGSRILSISELTLNASGTKSNPLIFEGNYETFAANINVKGNYIRFQNFELTGTVTITETVRKTLDNYISRLPENLIASLDNSVSFINWTTTTTNMAIVSKQIEFENTTVTNLIIGQNQTKIISDTDLSKVSVVANVKEIEIQSDITRMIVNTDVPLTVYGEGNIERTEYNSVTDLNLYTEGTISTLVVDNLFGWLDLGVDTDVTNVILPKSSTPNQAFGDYLVDINNITNIKDPSGNVIDKNPVENQQPVDKTAPIISGLAVTSLNSGQAKVDFTVTEGGNYYYIVEKKGVDAPSLKEIVKGPPAVAGRTGRMYTGSNTFTASGLEEKSEYVIYLVGVDGSGNASLIGTSTFLMKDSQPPTINGLNLDPVHGGQRLKFNFIASEPGTYYYYYRVGIGPQDTAVTAQYIKANANGSGSVTLASQPIEKTFTGLTPLTSYEVYVVLEDTSGNLSTVTFDKERTSDLDNISPYVPAAKQALEKTGLNQFTVYFSEPLDYESANNVNNYILSGTGIYNISGQTKIPPSSVEYIKGDTKAVITVPSTTGLVNNDTIRVTMQPTLLDLAGNPFESSTTQQTPRNYAVYKHGDTIKPVLTVKNFQSNLDYTHGLLDVETSEAGTYYYVILPSVNTATNLSMRDIMDRKLQALLPTGINNATTMQVVPEMYYGTFSPIEYGKSTLDVPIPNNLSPFHSWNMYIFMTDRSGNLTNSISTVPIINDRVAPEITLATTPIAVQPGDITAKLQFNSNEPGGVRYILREKYNTDGSLAPTATIEEVKASSNTLQMVEGPNDPLFNVPKAHKDYVLYYAMYDTAGNYTSIRSLEFYSDGTPPEVVGVAEKQVLPGQLPYATSEFKITFSEALDWDSVKNNLKIYQLDSDNDPTNDVDISNQFNLSTAVYTAGSTSTSGSQLVVTANTDIQQSFKVVLTGSDLADIQSQIATTTANVFTSPTNTAKYEYPGAKTNIFTYAMLNGSLIPGAPTLSSQEMYVSIDIGVDLGLDQEYYYAVTNSTQSSLTPAEIISTIQTGIPAPGITQFGTAKLDPANASGASFSLLLTANQSSDGISTPVFNEGHHVFLVTKDKYGNLVMAQDLNNAAQKYTVIKRQGSQ